MNTITTTKKIVKVINPLTGRSILKGNAMYRKLVRQGVIDVDGNSLIIKSQPKEETEAEDALADDDEQKELILKRAESKRQKPKQQRPRSETLDSVELAKVVSKASNKVIQSYDKGDIQIPDNADLETYLTEETLKELQNLGINSVTIN